MSSLGVAAAVAGLVLSNLLWWRRSRRVRETLTTSHERDERVGAGHTAPVAGGSATAVETLEAAAERADCPPEELPDQIARLRERIADAETDADRRRETLANAWWETLAREPGDEPRVVTVTLDRGETADARALADCAQHSERTVAVVVAGADDAVAVGVGEAVREVWAADEVVEAITEAAGGGGGGSPGFATGGGCDPDALGEAIEDVTARLRRDLEE